MNNPYDLVVFDWEGTIADTLGAVFHIVAVEANLMGLDLFDHNEAKKYVDLGLARALKKVYPNLSPREHEHLLQAVQQAMYIRSTEVCLIPGVREFIDQLHEAKINMAIATNKGQQSLIRALQVTGLDKIIKVTRSAGQLPAKPCPQMLEEIIEEFGGNRVTTLMIGDSVIDMEMARKIQVSALGVDFYQQHGTALKIAGALAVFDDYRQVAQFLGLNKE